MDPGQVMFAVVTVIGAPVVAWLANRIVALGERVSRLEARKCGCDERQVP